MRLTNEGIAAIDKQEIRLKLALGLGFTEGWIISLIGANKNNGPLTTAKALQIIRTETKLKDSQLLEEPVLESKHTA